MYTFLDFWQILIHVYIQLYVYNVHISVMFGSYKHCCFWVKPVQSALSGKRQTNRQTDTQSNPCQFSMQKLLMTNTCWLTWYNNNEFPYNITMSIVLGRQYGCTNTYKKINILDYCSSNLYIEDTSWLKTISEIFQHDLLWIDIL